MSKVKLDPIFREISGSMGGIIFKTSKAGETIVARRPYKRKSAPTEAQIAQQNAFRQAVAYARAALADPSARRHYEEQARRRKQTAYTVAVADYFKGKNVLRDERDSASFDPGI